MKDKLQSGYKPVQDEVLMTMRRKSAPQGAVFDHLLIDGFGCLIAAVALSLSRSQI